LQHDRAVQNFLNKPEAEYRDGIGGMLVDKLNRVDRLIPLSGDASSRRIYSVFIPYLFRIYAPDIGSNEHYKRVEKLRADPSLAQMHVNGRLPDGDLNRTCGARWSGAIHKGI